MTYQQHREYHVLLHDHLDELLANYISAHPDQARFLDMPVRELVEWSAQQAENPT